MVLTTPPPRISERNFTLCYVRRDLVTADATKLIGFTIGFRVHRKFREEFSLRACGPDWQFVGREYFKTLDELLLVAEVFFKIPPYEWTACHPNRGEKLYGKPISKVEKIHKRIVNLMASEKRRRHGFTQASSFYCHAARLGIESAEAQPHIAASEAAWRELELRCAPAEAILRATLLRSILHLPFIREPFLKFKTMTPLADLETMFDNMRSQTDWNVEGDLLWGYFFFDPSPAKLQVLADALEKIGYTIANLYPSDDKTTHVLHMEKIETHSPQSLFTRNEELQRVALAHTVASYDGMDVGPLNLI
jgi:hypothetical protein